MPALDDGPDECRFGRWRDLEIQPPTDETRAVARKIAEIWDEADRTLPERHDQ